jgi:hypothetical protein
MSDKLAENLWPGNVHIKKDEGSPDDKVIKALERALETTTPEHAGTSWEKKEEEEKSEQERWWVLPQGD